MASRCLPPGPAFCPQRAVGFCFPPLVGARGDVESRRTFVAPIALLAQRHERHSRIVAVSRIKWVVGREPISWIGGIPRVEPVGRVERIVGHKTVGWVEGIARQIPVGWIEQVIIPHVLRREALSMRVGALRNTQDRSRHD